MIIKDYKTTVLNFLRVAARQSLDYKTILTKYRQIDYNIYLLIKHLLD